MRVPDRDIADGRIVISRGERFRVCSDDGNVAVRRVSWGARGVLDVLGSVPELVSIRDMFSCARRWPARRSMVDRADDSFKARRKRIPSRKNSAVEDIPRSK
jgi:hypothetical protein